MESEPIHLSVTSHPDNLKQIRGVMADVTSQAKISKEIAGSIILAVDEACSNIIRHSYKNDHNQKIELTIHCKKDALTICVIDDGITFDINSIKARDINEVKPGGLGIYIIKQVMDTVEYCRTPDGSNKITMQKQLNG